MSDLMQSKGWKPRTGKVKTCPSCGLEFYLKPSYQMRKFCSPKCASESFKKDKIRFNCEVCKKYIYKTEKQILHHSKPRYCSKTCMGKVSKKFPETGKIKSSNRKSLKTRLDKYFSEYIRLRDTDENWVGRCCSCGKVIHYSEGDAGHYINRSHLATRWREDNVFLQCRHCNRFLEGNGSGYSIFIIKKYGISKIEYLDALKNESIKYTESELELLIEEYKKKRKDLKSKKTVYNAT